MISYFLKQTPPLVRHLLIINIVAFVAMLPFRAWMIEYGALFPVVSPYFHFHQFITHLFLHGGLWHILLNMLVLWSFGSILERVWGTKRFFLFYFSCGFIAGIIHEVATLIQMQQSLSYSSYADAPLFSSAWFDALQQLPQALVPTIGASGAVSGAIIAFALLFPNSIILVYMIPMKAKYLAVLLLIVEILFGTWGGHNLIANWAHVGGGLAGLIIGYIWKRKGYHLR